MPPTLIHPGDRLDKPMVRAIKATQRLTRGAIRVFHPGKRVG